MADVPAESIETRADLNSRTADLRRIASAHLEEIAAEQEQERGDEIARLQFLQQYLAHSRMTRSARRDESAATRVAKAPRLRSAEDVIDRIRWDSLFKSSDFLVGYLERFEGIKEMPLDSWIGELTDEEWIPQHRIKYFRRISTDEVVWHRDKRIDMVFGSGLGSGS